VYDVNQATGVGEAEHPLFLASGTEEAIALF